MGGDQPKKGKRKSRKTNPDVHRFIKCYYDAYKHKYKRKPNFIPGKDASLILKLLTQYGSLSFLENMLKFYMFDNDEVVRKFKHSIGVFYMQRELLSDRVRRSNVGRSLLPPDQEAKKAYAELKKRIMKKLFSETPS